MARGLPRQPRACGLSIGAQEAEFSVKADSADGSREPTFNGIVTPARSLMQHGCSQASDLAPPVVREAI